MPPSERDEGEHIDVSRTFAYSSCEDPEKHTDERKVSGALKRKDNNNEEGETFDKRTNGCQLNPTGFGQGHRISISLARNMRIFIKSFLFCVVFNSVKQNIWLVDEFEHI